MTSQPISIMEVSSGYFQPDQTDSAIVEIGKSLRRVPLFLDIGGALENPSAFLSIRDIFNKRYAELNDIDAIAMFDSRGFLFGTQIAQHLGLPCVMLRKKGKLPGVTVSLSYSTEYSTDSLCVNVESIRPGQRFLLVDDILATGGTMIGGAKLLQSLGAVVVECAVVASLDFLGGVENFRKADENFSKIRFFSMIASDSVPPPPTGHSTESKNLEIGSEEFKNYLLSKN